MSTTTTAATASQGRLFLALTASRTFTRTPDFSTSQAITTATTAPHSSTQSPPWV